MLLKITVFDLNKSIKLKYLYSKIHQLIMKNELSTDISLNRMREKYVNILFALGAIVLSCLFYEMKNKEMWVFMIPFVFTLYSLIVNRKTQLLKNSWPVLPVLIYLVARGFENSFDWTYLYAWKFWGTLLTITSQLLLGFFIGCFALKWKTIQRNYPLVILTVVSFALAILSIHVSLQFQFFAVGFIYFAAPCLAYYYITQKKYVAWIIILPFVLLYALSILFEDATIRCYPNAFIPIVSASMYCLIRLLAKPVNWVLLAGYVAFLLYGWYAGMECYFRWVEI
jgi:hypothetical protein